VSDSTLVRWRAGHRREAVIVGGMKCEEGKRLKHLEDENRRLKQLVADPTILSSLPTHSVGGLGR
jgi:hypothetical protein